MKVIGICGSPRLGGNTETLIMRALDVLESENISTEFISLAGKTIAPCSACMGCSSSPDCSIKDDFQEIYRAMIAADGIILGSPVYFGSATASMKALMDRAGYVARKNGNLFNRKVGGPIVVARRAGENFTLSQLLAWYMISGMIVPGSTYWNIAIARDKDEVMNDAEGVATIDTFALNLAWLMKKLASE